MRRRKFRMIELSIPRTQQWQIHSSIILSNLSKSLLLLNLLEPHPQNQQWKPRLNQQPAAQETRRHNPAQEHRYSRLWEGKAEEEGSLLQTCCLHQKMNQRVKSIILCCIGVVIIGLIFHSIEPEDIASLPRRTLLSRLAHSNLYLVELILLSWFRAAKNDAFQRVTTPVATGVPTSSASDDSDDSIVGEHSPFIKNQLHVIRRRYIS